MRSLPSSHVFPNLVVVYLTLVAGAAASAEEQAADRGKSSLTSAGQDGGVLWISHGGNEAASSDAHARRRTASVPAGREAVCKTGIRGVIGQLGRTADGRRPG